MLGARKDVVGMTECSELDGIFRQENCCAAGLVFLKN